MKTYYSKSSFSENTKKGHFVRVFFFLLLLTEMQVLNDVVIASVSFKFQLLKMLLLNLQKAKRNILNQNMLVQVW